jgi:hypothetical protein
MERLSPGHGVVWAQMAKRRQQPVADIQQRKAIFTRMSEKRTAVQTKSPQKRDSEGKNSRFIQKSLGADFCLTYIEGVR